MRHISGCWSVLGLASRLDNNVNVHALVKISDELTRYCTPTEFEFTTHTKTVQQRNTRIKTSQVNVKGKFLNHTIQTKIFTPTTNK